ncbi:MAG: SpoVG family protein [Candidatus Omnitrophica bacterium]|nr:SpoVG family protein [Candidatus Omnitrophota bacterium]MBU1932491.1 SpoVG family protein [Candidatus Omnitrophota bacterium]
MEVARMHRLEGDSKLKAFADVSFAGVFMVKGLRVVEGKNGLFVSMPSEKGKDGKWYDTARPLTKEFRQLLNEAVLESYESE